MNWIAPEVARDDEPWGPDERATLETCLESHRATLLWKCAGLTPEQLVRRAVPPSSLSLLGLVRHLADAERAWFRRHFRDLDVPEIYFSPDRPDAAFDEASAEHAEADYLRLIAECAMSRDAVADARLSDPCAHPKWSELTLHGVYVHMIEEYARHNGHADLLRQRIDGAVGE